MEPGQRGFAFLPIRPGLVWHGRVARDGGVLLSVFIDPYCIVTIIADGFGLCVFVQRGHDSDDGIVFHSGEPDHLGGETGPSTEQVAILFRLGGHGCRTSTGAEELLAFD